MRKFSKKQYLAAGAAAVIVASGAGVAFAYWTSTGTGSGSATTGSSSEYAITSDAAVGSPLTPGGGSQTVAVHVKNTNSGHQKLQALTVVVKNSDGTTWTSGSCSAADYTVSVPVVTPIDLAPSGTNGDTYNTTATISMNNLSSNQDDCKGATVPLYFAAS